ncbi:RNA polymerase sigma-70 factor [Cellulomonas alba]|uniref:RNA polymerase sigma-70 factor n=1 Tax=Cellulomonas alba TaxID=3053467 RepID=A0ABT7SJV9_9CELL|nr:RNA polymerase sigma-70 factor [Cellulomonas alba]MDM7855839.1 RNA polymerase sigma-70 factor [Cellulomonas alba]
MGAAEFEQLRPLLFSIAYRILGSVSEAEDAVQETWLRYDAADVDPASLKSFLSAIVTRVSIDVLRSARVRRESYVGQWLPEPLLTDGEPEASGDPLRAAELADSLSMAALLLLERLTPEQRAVFVLHDVFAFPFAEVAQVIGRSETACRQLASRARRLVEDGRPRFDVDRREREELAGRFFDAMTAGDVDALRELLAADVEVYGDGGGNAPQWTRVVRGSDNVARMFGGLGRRFAGVGLQVEPHEVNGQPGAVLRDASGRVINVFAFDVLDGRIQVVRSVINPEKLRHLGPVADAWALMRDNAPGGPAT